MTTQRPASRKLNGPALVVAAVGGFAAILALAFTIMTRDPMILLFGVVSVALAALVAWLLAGPRPQ